MAVVQQNDVDWLATELLSGFCQQPITIENIVVTGIALDSRVVQSGDLFFAVAGTQQHGIQHLSQAVTAGAILVLAEKTEAIIADDFSNEKTPVLWVTDLAEKVSAIAARFYGHPGKVLRTIGITGTNGKTSVSHFLATALADSWDCAIMGTTGIGFPERLQPATHTTPDAVTVQSTLGLLSQSGAKSLAMEVSSHALDQYRIQAVPVHTAVFTNLTRDHLDYHGTMKAYANAKLQLFKRTELQLAVINASDDLAATLVQVLNPDCQLVQCFMQPQENIVGDYLCLQALTLSDKGIRFSFDSSWGSGEIVSQLLGAFNAHNLLLAAGVMLAWDIPLPQVIKQLQMIVPVIGRMQSFGGNEQPLVVVDFAHTPDALEQALMALRKHTKGDLICVFGCGGGRDTGKRPLMGAIAQCLADRVLITDDNPRHEASAQIISQIQAGMNQLDHGQSATVIADRSVAIHQAISQARIGDVVLVAGKGHETYQQVAGLKMPFNDIQQVQHALQEWQHA